MESMKKSQRRDFVKMAVLVGTTVVVSGVPLASYVITPSLHKGIGKWMNFGAIENLPSGDMKMLLYKFMDKDGWQILPRQSVVWAKAEADGRLTIFSSVCPHLNCTVSWKEADKRFECPCHTGRFDANGQPTAGPPTRPLTVLEHKIEDGNLLVFLPS